MLRNLGGRSLPTVQPIRVLRTYSALQHAEVLPETPRGLERRVKVRFYHS